MSRPEDVTANGQVEVVREAHAVPLDVQQTIALQTHGVEPLEVMIIGTAKDMKVKAKMMKGDKPFGN